MARVRLSGIATEIRGRIAASQWATSGSRTSVRKKPLKKNFASGHASSSVQTFRAAQSQWVLLTEAQRDEFRSFFGSSSAFVQFTRIQYLRLVQGLPLVLNPRMFASKYSISVSLISFSGTTCSIRVTYSGTFSGGLACSIFVAAPVNPGNNGSNLRWRLNSVPTLGSSPATVSLTLTQQWPSLYRSPFTQSCFIKFVFFDRNSSKFLQAQLFKAN